MSAPRRARRVLAAVAVLALTVLAPVAATAGPAHPDGNAHTLIQGTGSSWAFNALNTWIGDVKASGIQVALGPTGSAQGRKDFANQTTDFGVSDIGFQGTDPATGANDTNQGRPYAYLPVVAGGTAFPYNLRGKNGQRMINLRLSGPSLAKIFTNEITYWDDPQIVADNNGNPQLPHTKIIPVVHEEGSGSTFQFTAYLENQFPSIWQPFGGQAATEYFPRQGSQVAEDGSDGVMNFITGGAGNGSIGFDEYSYALFAGYPVAKVLNAAGYYTLPNQYNVAVALTQAIINKTPGPNYLLQDLHQVYAYGDPRTYPLSSYSYMIIPTSSTDSKMGSGPAKRQTIADYLYYSICQGQAETGNIGYSPLPVNLVSAGFDQIALLHQANPQVNLNGENVQSCHNPTFDSADLSKNYLAQVAPQPPACDKSGAGPCADGGSTGQKNPDASGHVASTGGGSAATAKGASGGSGAGASGALASGAAGAAAAGTTAGALAGGAAGDGTTTSGTSTTSADAEPTTTVVGDHGVSGGVALAVVCVVLLGAIALPAVVGAFRSRRTAP